MARRFEHFRLGTGVVAFLRRVDDLACCLARCRCRLARYRCGLRLRVGLIMIALVVRHCGVARLGLRPGEVHERPLMARRRNHNRSQSHRFRSGISIRSKMLATTVAGPILYVTVFRTCSCISCCVIIVFKSMSQCRNRQVFCSSDSCCRFLVEIYLVCILIIGGCHFPSIIIIQIIVISEKSTSVPQVMIATAITCRPSPRRSTYTNCTGICIQIIASLLE